MEIVWTLESGEIAAVRVDASVREAHSYTAQATELAVERGVNISDHVRPQPTHLTIEGVVTNTPIVDPGTQMDGATGQLTALDVSIPQAAELRANRNEVGGGRAGIGRPLGPASIAANVLVWSAQFDRVRTVNDVITRLVETGTLVKVVTSLRDYPNMVIESFEVTRSAEAGGSLPFAMTAKQIRIVDTETVSLPEPTEPRGRPGQNRGAQPGEPVSPDENATLWYNASGTVSQWFSGSRGVFQ